MRLLFLILFFPFLQFNPDSPEIIEHKVEETCLSPMEKELISLVNKYRKKHKLKSIPASKSLSFVAQKHVRELNDEIKDLTHSWVDCKYNGMDTRTFDCMWEMPRQLADYPGKGYECGFVQWGKDFSAADILEGWQDSRGHDDVIMNRRSWKKSEWNAVGVGIYGDYAVIWFGEEKDPKGRPSSCR